MIRREDSKWWRNGFTAEWWKLLTQDERRGVLDTLTDAECEDFLHDWRVWGRDKQLNPPGDDNWSTWLLKPGRGFGKSKTGSEWIRDGVEHKGIVSMCLLGQGEDDVREVMIEGPSGIISCSTKAWRPKYYPSVGAGRLIWPNGAIAYTYSAADPEALRGPQFQRAWVDEPMAFNPEQRTKALYNLRFGLRMKAPGGIRPQRLYTTTPKPHRWIRDIVKRAETDPKIRVTNGSMLENLENLSEDAIDDVMSEFEGTSLGRQEIYGEILGDEDGALFQETILDKYRIRPPPEIMAAMAQNDNEPFERWIREFARTCDKIVIGVDPNVTEGGKTTHAAGIIVCGKKDGRRFLICDRSTKGGPSRWGAAVLIAYEDFNADEIVVEVNQGGDMIKALLLAEAETRGMDIVVKKVRAWKGKARRAEPVSAAYESGKVSHLGTVGHQREHGPLFMVESQLCALHDGFDPTGEDFDRADACVYGMTRLAKKRDDDSDESEGGGAYTFAEMGAAA